jgi:hypothetical protein|nr:MAG TPA: hypothetical protein [Caudoviricetes sp.]
MFNSIQTEEDFNLFVKTYRCNYANRYLAHKYADIIEQMNRSIYE